MSEELQPSNPAPAAKNTSSLGRHFRVSLEFIAGLIGCLALLFWLLLPSGHSPEPGFRSHCRNNLKQIGLALHNYHDAFGCFPPAYIADEKGRPMHSWRVLILPYFDQSNSYVETHFDAKFYKQYHFDEPWDGPNNHQLHDKAIGIFNCPSETSKLKARSSANTNYVAIVGPDTMWPGSKPVKISDITDGTSNTLMVVETTNSGIHWMEPRDLHVLQMAPTINSPGGQGVSSKHHAGAQVSLADGSTRFLSETLPAETLRALLTINGKEPLPEGDF